MTTVEPVERARRGETAVAPEVLRKLDSWPPLASLVRERFRPAAGRPPLSGEEVENRVGTLLMALYRDTRSEEIFEALYSFSGPAVLRWIRSLLRKGLGHLDASELLQDTFVNVYRYPGSFREDHAGSYRVWVRTIAGNIVRRASSKHAPVLFQELPEGLREPADDRAGPELQAVAGEQSAKLRQAWVLFLCHYAAAWEQLAPRDRRALELVEVRGCTYEAAGRILGVRRSNMKMIIFRSRKRIAARMRLAMRPAASSGARLRMAG